MMQNYLKISEVKKYIKDFKPDEDLIKKHRSEFRPFKKNNEISITEEDFIKLCEWDRGHYRIDELIEEALSRSEKTGTDVPLLRKKYYEKHGKCNEWQTGLYYHPGNFFVKEKDRETGITQVLSIIMENDPEKTIVKISDYKDLAEKQRKRIKQNVEAINNKRGKTFVLTDRLEEFIGQDEQYISLQQIVELVQSEIGITLPGNINSSFKAYLNKNKYFGLWNDTGDKSLNYQNKEIILKKKDVEEKIDKFFWFFVKKCKGTESDYRRAKELLKKEYPQTVDYYVEYSADGYKGDYEIPTKVLLVMSFLLKKEICDYFSGDIFKLLNECLNESPTIERELERFITYAQAGHKNDFRVKEITTLQRGREHKEGVKESYSYEDYVFMAGLSYCDDYIEKAGIIRKAIESRAAANIILNMQMHFVSMWREEDYCELGPVDIPGTINLDEMIEIIKRGEYPEEGPIINDMIIIFEMQANERRALKTGELLHLYIPKVAFKYVSMFLIINEYHRQKEDAIELIDRNNLSKMDIYRNLYGEAIVEDVFKNKPFSNRRANHSYAGRLSMQVENKCVNGKQYAAYLLVGFARSHKGSLDRLPKATSAYLEAKTNGIPTNVFIMEVFSRGFCGFGLYTLLSLVLPDFNELGVKDQTKIMEKAGLSAAQIEKISEKVLACDKDRDKFIKDLFGQDTNAEDCFEKIAELVHNVITDNASVSPNKPCLRKAAGDINPDCDRNCVYCRYGILNRYNFYTLIKEYEHNNNMALTVKNPEKAKLFRQINEDIVGPAIISFCKELKEVQGIDSNIIERLSEEIDAECRINERRKMGELSSPEDPVR